MNLADLVHIQAKKNPDHIAFIFKEQEISFRDLEDRVLRCAESLRKIGIKQGSTFGLVLRNSPEFVIFTLALTVLGAVAVPINFLEKPDRIALILKDAGAVGVLTAKEFYRSVSKAVEGVKSVKTIVLREGKLENAVLFESLLSSERFQGEPNNDSNNLALLLYTSGTTGQPKGVMLTNKNLISNMDQCLGAIELDAKDRFLCLLPMFHSFAWTTCVLIPLKLGCRCVINESLLPFDPVIKAIWKYKITLFVAVPQIYSALTAKIKGVKALLLRFLNPIRICISGAAPLPDSVFHAFEKSFHIPLLEGYGLTETSPVATLNPVNHRKMGTVGKALPHVSLKICDDEGNDLPRGRVGEVWIKGPNVMQGYYNKPKETKMVLTNDQWLKSGDMGKLDEEGYLTIVDRKKDLIIVKGLNVYPQEVENVIAEDPSIQEVAVIGKMDPQTGDELIRAFVTLKEGKPFDKAKLIERCKEKLSPYKRPKEFIQLDEMPKNALQKILKKDLRKR